jgi:hypothetical protein
VESGTRVSGLAGLLVGRRPGGVYVWRSRLALADVGHAIEHAGWRPFLLDGRAVMGEDQLLRAIAAACEFPDGRGSDWDGCTRCLADLSWVPTKRGYVLLYEGWAMLALTEPETWLTARGLFEGACAHWARTPTPMAVLLRGSGPDDLPELY